MIPKRISIFIGNTERDTAFDQDLLKKQTTMKKHLSFLCSLAYTLAGFAQPMIPNDQYVNTAVGNSHLDASKGLLQTEIKGAAINKYGRVFAITTFDEAQRKAGIYQDGNLAGSGNVGPTGNYEPIGGEFIAVNETSVFAQASNQQVHAYDFDGIIRSGVYELNFELSGLAASNRYLVASRSGHSRVYVFDLFSKEVVSDFTVASATHVAINNRNEIFVLSNASPRKIYKYDVNGNHIADVITLDSDIIPSSLAIDNRGRLMFGDNGASKQVHFYDVSHTPAILDETFGQYGGMHWGQPFSHEKLWNIKGVGTDMWGNIFITLFDNASFIYKISPRGDLIWKMFNTFFVDSGGFDPASDGKDFYGPAEHFVIDFARQPGEDSRLGHITGQEDSFNTAIMRRVDGHLLRYRTGMFGNAYQVYRYEGFKSVHTGYTHPTNSWGTYVDENGTIWDGKGTTFKKSVITGFTAQGNPIFSTSNAGTRPDIFTSVERLLYEPDTDVMYIAGYTHENPIVPDWGQIGTEVARYDNWSVDPQFQWRKIVQREFQGVYSNPNVIVQAGDYIFYGGGLHHGQNERGNIWVMRKSDGELVGILTPSYHVGGKDFTGWIDMGFAIEAFQRSNGEYLIAVEDDGWGRNLIYRWCPTADCSYEPAAYAGDDITIKLPLDSVTLAGSGAVFKGSITNFNWEKISGGDASLEGVNNDTLFVKDLTEGIYEFKLTVEDNHGLFATDTVTVTVVPPNENNQPPVAHAGIDLDITLPENAVTLIGKGTDSDGEVVGYFWSQAGGPEAALSDPHLPDLVVTELTAGSYTFALTVIDDDGDQGTDTVALTVHPSPDDEIPSTPENLSLVEVTLHEISFEWEPSTDNVGVIGYEIFFEHPYGDVLVGRNNATNYHLTGLNSNTEFAIYVKAVDAAGNTSEKSNTLIVETPSIPAISAIKTDTPPVIDGQMDEIWETAQVYPLARGLNDPYIIDEADFSVSFRALWDLDSLYLMAEIKDLNFHSIPPFPWESDGIEFYFDMNNDKEMSLGAYNYQLGFAWQHSIYGDFSEHIQMNINYIFVKKDDGYIMEAAIPWDYGLFFDRTTQSPRADMPDIEPGLIFGFDVAANDNDTGTGRESVLMYYCSPEGSYWSQPNRWGIMELNEKQAQTIEFEQLTNAIINNYNTLHATSSSGLPVIFERLYGNAELIDDQLKPLQMNDRIIIRAIQEGDETYARAEVVQWITQIGTTAPTVNAGPDKNLPTDSTQTKLFGSATAIEGREIVSYLWEQTSGQSVTMTGQNTPTLHLSGLIEGFYSFRLSATDDHDESGYDHVNVLVYQEGGPCEPTGKILYERWNDIPGTAVADLTNSPRYQEAPDVILELSILEAPQNVGDHYGCRIRGYICAPATGAYTFWVEGDDNVELWLSTDDDPANKVLIAYHTGWTFPGQWDKYPTQQSEEIFLVYNGKYYIEALMKEEAGGDNLALGWKLPDGTLERPIPGVYLSYDPDWADFESYIVSPDHQPFRFFPNPANDYIHLIIPKELLNNAVVSISSFYGSVIKTQKVTGKEVRIDISDLSAGFYLISITDGKLQVNAKMVKN